MMAARPAWGPTATAVQRSWTAPAAQLFVGLRFASSRRHTGPSTPRLHRSRDEPAAPYTEHTSRPPPSIHSESTRERSRALQSLLEDARRSGGPLRLPTILDRPTRPIMRAAPKRTTTRTNSPSASPTTTAARIQNAKPTGASVSDRQKQTHIDDLVDAMAQQMSIVQPENPHIANIVILGTPNAGKSTLVNHLVGRKISAVSHKRNTTRTSVLGVACRDNRQLVIFDTPGVLPDGMSNKYQRELTTAAWDSAQGVDLAVVIVDCVKKLGPAEYELFQKAKSLSESNPDMKLVLVMNKMDLCKPVSAARSIASLVQSHCAPFAHTYYTSFMTDRGVLELTNVLYSSAQPGEWEYPSSIQTDQSQVDLVNEIIREKIFHRVHQEIPYRVRITNTGWTHVDDESMRIDVLLEVDTKQQKLILTGHGGSMLRYLVQRALPEVQDVVGKKVFLFLKCAVATTL